MVNEKSRINSTASAHQQFLVTLTGANHSQWLQNEATQLRGEVGIVNRYTPKRLRYN